MTTDRSLNDAELVAEIRRLDKEATPGPWSAECLDDESDSWQVSEPLVTPYDDGDYLNGKNAALIAAYRTLAVQAAERLETYRKRRIVCLCGSTRFMQAYEEANLRETLAGNIVLSVGTHFHADNELENLGRVSKEDKARLDALHFDKIALADEILVLNVGGYIGESTTREVRHALSLGKQVRWLEPNSIPLEIHALLKEAP